MKSEKCHIIPRFILKKFADSNNKICCYRKGKPDTFPSDIKDAYAHLNFYHWVELNLALDRIGSNRQAESMLADLENVAATILYKIENAINSSKTFSLNKQEIFDLFRFFYLMTLRNPAVAETNPELKQPKEAFESKVAQYGKVIGTTNSKFMQDITRNAQVCLILEVLLRSLPSADTPWTARSSSKNKEVRLTDISKCHFSIRSSNTPKLVVGNYPYAKVDSKIWFPVSPQIALARNSFGHGETMELDDKFVAKFNSDIFQKSTQISALHEEQLLVLIEQNKQVS